MTAVDFSSFVNQLATASGDMILPFFRTALAVENKKVGGFDPVTAADRAAVASANPGAPLYEYQADHGFNCDRRDSYDAASAAVAWQRTLAFLAEHVG